MRDEAAPWRTEVLQLLGDLQAKVIKEGEGQQQIYEEFTDWCAQLQFDIGETPTAKRPAGRSA